MAANSFDEILAQIAEPELKDALTKATEKYPDLKGGWLRQSDYSRKMNEFDGEFKTAKAKAEYADKWEQWKNDNWLPDLNMTKEEEAATRRALDLEKEVETLRQSKEGDVTFEEIQAEVDKLVGAKMKGVVTEETLKKDRENYLDKTTFEREMTNRLLQTENGLTHVFLKTYPLGFQHQKEFGEVLDPQELVKYAVEKKINDLGEAYNSMVATRRTEVQGKAMEEKLAEAKRQGAEEAKKAAAMGPNGRMPVDSGAPEMTHLQERIMKKSKSEDPDATKAIPEDVKADGSGRLAQLVAEQWRKDQLTAA